jgi:phosphoglycolate phosphatase
MTSPPKTIVYDWNGTLFDDAPIACRCNSLIVESLGYPAISLDAYQHHFDMPIDRLYRGLGLAEADVEKIGNSLGTSFHDSYEPLADKAPLREGAGRLLAYAHTHGVRQIILSNHLIDPIRRQLNRLEISSFISDVLANATKERQFRDGPKSERLRHYMLSNGLEPQHTIIVGDSPEETHIARELALISIAVMDGFVAEQRLRNAQPDFLIRSLSEIPALLQQLGFIP